MIRLAIELLALLYVGRMFYNIGRETGERAGAKPKQGPCYDTGTHGCADPTCMYCNRVWPLRSQRHD